MANIVTSTEALDDTGVWTHANGLTVTANTHAAPEFAGPLAGMADTVVDNSASQSLILGTYYDIATDSADYVGSVYIRKDAITDRWPEFAVSINTGPIGLVSVNTSTGAIADGGSPPAASGIVNVDATWWRLWLRIANNGTGTAIRIYCYPSRLDALGGEVFAEAVGSVVLWGFNITQSSAVQTYEPEPFYVFDPPATTQNLYYRRRR